RREVRRLGNSGLQTQQGFPARWIHWSGGMVVHDQPGTVDLPKTVRCANPETISPRPIFQRSAESIETVPECHIVADGDCDVAHLHTERTLKECEGRDPVLAFCLCSDVPEPWSHVERHHVRRVQRLQTLEVRAANRLRQPAELLTNLDFVNGVLGCHA